MEIKEVENLLSVSRSNIRFYEKEGLIDPKRGKNNYRKYSEADVAMLKKIIICRKLNFSVEEISAMQKGELPLSDAIGENIARLEAEIEKLQGALETAKMLSSEQVSFAELDEERYWDLIQRSEADGKAFVDICKDYLTFELQVFDTMWKYVFFHNFEKSRKKHGTLVACGILLLICTARGIGKVVFWHEDFWSGFFYPIFLFLIATVIFLPIYLLNKKVPKVARVVNTIIFILAVGFLALCILLLVVGLTLAVFQK